MQSVTNLKWISVNNEYSFCPTPAMMENMLNLTSFLTHTDTGNRWGNHSPNGDASTSTLSEGLFHCCTERFSRDPSAVVTRRIPVYIQHRKHPFVRNNRVSILCETSLFRLDLTLFHTHPIH